MYRPRICSAWSARARTRGIGSSVCFSPRRWMATSDMSSETVITGTSIWRPTRSAVRWRVPVSDVGTLGSGTRCTLARATRDVSEARMIAPSILASSESRWGVNSASSRNPPEQTDSTSGPSPTTMSAPMRAWRMRSRPSRSGVPGATSRRATIMASDRGGAGTVALSLSVWSPTTAERLRIPSALQPAARRRTTRCSAAEQRRVDARRARVGDLDRVEARRVGDRARRDDAPR